MPHTYRIVAFNRETPVPSADLAFLHEELLPRSPVVKLGRQFMEKCYYTILPKEGLVFGLVAYVDDMPAGFTCGTEDTVGFLRTALRRHWLRIACAVSSALIASPRRILALWEGFRVVSARGNEAVAGSEAELLTTGVLPAYLSRSFFKEARLRIGEDLLLGIMAEMERRGVSRARTIIDEDNGLSRSFVQRHGWELEAENVPGWKHRSVSYVWSPAKSAAGATSVEAEAPLMTQAV